MLLVAGWAQDAGLEPGIDEFGNLWALPAGADRVVTSGSHVDTVPDGGRYDGALGSVLGLELVHDLAHHAGLLVCAAEEAPRFGAGTVGSRLLVGSLPVDALSGLTDAQGITAGQALNEYLGALSDLPRVQPAPARVIAHGEVHVAQRRALRELGVVTRVASPRRLRVTIGGRSGHSGEVSMEDRRDALAAAAEVVLAVEAAARAEPPQTVATAGTLEIAPGAISVIPGQARIGIDARGISGASLDRLEAAIRSEATAIAERRGVSVEVELVRAGEPVELDRGLAQAALAAADDRGIPATETWSGSGHDSQHLAALFPTLLMFVPLEGGESHTPLEGADESDIENASLIVRDVLSVASQSI